MFAHLTNVTRTMVSDTEGYKTAKLYLCSYYRSPDDFDMWFETHLRYPCPIHSTKSIAIEIREFETT